MSKTWIGENIIHGNTQYVNTKLRENTPSLVYR